MGLVIGRIVGHSERHRHRAQRVPETSAPRAHDRVEERAEGVKEIVALADEPEAVEAHKISHGRFQMLRASEYRTMTNENGGLPDSTGKTWAQWQREVRKVFEQPSKPAVCVGQEE